jgi:hypothetical protein
MARTQYETQEDLERESRVAQSIARLKGDGWVKVPAHYADTCDVVFLRGGNEIVCYCEIRTRTFRWGEYPTVMISLHKYLKGINLAQTALVPWMFAVETKQGIYAYFVDPLRWEPKRYRHTFSGRNQLRDSADVEPIVHLPIGEFKKIVTYDAPIDPPTEKPTEKPTDAPNAPVVADQPLDGEIDPQMPHDP